MKKLKTNRCLQCGKKIENPSRKLCSYACLGIYTGKIRAKINSSSLPCLNCGKIITRKNSKMNKKIGVFCNRKCVAKYKHKAFEKRRCLTCKKFFETKKKSFQRYCSYKCMKIVKKCLLCEKKFTTKTRYATNQNYCCEEHRLIGLSKGKICKVCGKPIHRSCIYCSYICEAEDFKTRFKGKNNPNFGKGEKVVALWKDPKSNYRKIDKFGKKNPNYGNGQAVIKRWKEGRYDKMLANTKLKNYTLGYGGYYKGIWFRSSWERIFVRLLDGVKIKWNYGKVFTFKNGIRYISDFYILKNKEYVEIKGVMDKRSKYKLKLFNKEYPKLKKVILRNREEWENYIKNNSRISEKKFNKLNKRIYKIISCEKKDHGKN